jgi:hypothetical protein
MTKEQYDHYLEDDQEYETGDIYVENIADDDHPNLIFKYLSLTHE